jgi:hypothetical protein
MNGISNKNSPSEPELLIPITKLQQMWDDHKPEYFEVLEKIGILGALTVET